MGYTKNVKFKIKKHFIGLILLLTASFCSPGLNSSYAEATGKIVVANDASTLSFVGFWSGGYSTGVFANNVANWFTDGLNGTFAVNNAAAFDCSNLNLNNQGHIFECPQEFPNDLDTLLTYDAIFISGEDVDNELLIQYVNSGGNVYISGGAGPVAIDEADQWKTFLTYFGLSFTPESSLEPNEYNGITGSIVIDGAHPIFDDIPTLYQDSGNDIVDIDPMDDRGMIIVDYAGHGLYAVFDGSQAGPEKEGDIGQEDDLLDSDYDGVPDINDACPATSEGEIVDIDGCSINDLCPCDAEWKNHRSYLKCIAQTSKFFESEGLIHKYQKYAYVSDAFKSRCGYKKAKFHWGHKKAKLSCDHKKAKFHWGHKHVKK